MEDRNFPADVGVLGRRRGAAPAVLVRLASRGLAGIVMILLAPRVDAAATLTDLGMLPGANITRVASVSGDGTVAVGTANGWSGDRAFRWTSGSGLVDLGGLPGASFPMSSAKAVSRDGHVVVGQARASSGGSNAFRWTATGGMQDLGNLPGGVVSAAHASSGDGSVVVGAGNTALGSRAFRWTQGGGMQSLGTLGGSDSDAHGVSDDGSVIVGRSGSDGHAMRAFRWTSGDGMQDLGGLAGRPLSAASGVSGDGSVVVGWCQSDPGNANPPPDFDGRAFRWTATGGMQDLGLLAGGTYSLANGTNADGTIVVGDADSIAGTRAMLWTASLGMVDLNLHLASIGVDLTGWDLFSAYAVSADGSTIVGEGTLNGANRGWIVSGLNFSPVAVPGSGSFVAVWTAAAGSRRRRRPRS